MHLAFRHDVAFGGDFDAALASDLAAIEALCDALAGSDRPLAIAAGIAGVKPGGLATERGASRDRAARPGRERMRGACARGARGPLHERAVLPPTVHRDGDHGFIAMVVAADRSAGSAAYIGDGANRWCAVHRHDAGRVVRLGIERAPAGSVLDAVGEEGVALRDVADAIGRGLDLPVTSIAAEQGEARFGFLAGFPGQDVRASNALTRELLSWQPEGPGLVADLEQGHYFTAVPA